MRAIVLLVVGVGLGSLVACSGEVVCEGAACSPAKPASEAGAETDARPEAAPVVDSGAPEPDASVDAAPPARVPVSLHWSYFVSRFPCDNGPGPGVTPISCSTRTLGDVCAGKADCSCTYCVGTQRPCPTGGIITRCCSASAQVLEGDEARLRADYPKCKIAKGAQGIAIECGPDSDPLITLWDGGPSEDGPRLIGAAPAHTDHCAWALPYAAK